MKKIFTVLLITYISISNLHSQEKDTLKNSSVSSPFNQSKFVPDISMILDFSYVSRDLNNGMFSELFIPGLTHHHKEASEHSHTISNAKKGFNLNYGELSFYSVVDPYFDLFAVLHVAQEHAGLEEAYFTTRKLPYGFQFKTGKFLSGFGRINEQHNHYLDFTERPLILSSIFGNEGLNELGAKINWIAPTDFYLSISTEFLMGENESSFGSFGFSDINKNVVIAEIENPSLFVGNIRTSFDIGEASYLTGLSFAKGKNRADHEFSDTENEGQAVDANTSIIGADLTIKYSLDAIKYISFQSEYIYRSIKGSFYNRDTALVVDKSEITKRHSGLYAQMISKFGLQWRAGIRYDLISQNEIKIGNANMELPKNLARYSFMIEYNPTEFSKIRLQCNHDKSKYLATTNGFAYKSYTELILQFNFAIGAHGAHAF